MPKIETLQKKLDSKNNQILKKKEEIKILKKDVKFLQREIDDLEKKSILDGLTPDELTAVKNAVKNLRDENAAGGDF